jgi:hypothetical protein
LKGGALCVCVCALCALCVLCVDRRPAHEGRGRVLEVRRRLCRGAAASGHWNGPFGPVYRMMLGVLEMLRWSGGALEWTRSLCRPARLMRAA